MDIIALILSLIGIFLNAKKIIWCWPIWISANVFWCIHFIFFVPQFTSVLLWIFFTVFNVYGWYEWNKENKLKNEISN